MPADGAMARGLGAERQTEDLDEPDRGGVVEGVVRLVCGQGFVVQRERAASSRHDRVAVVEPDAHLATDDTLAARRVAAQVAAAGR